MKKLIIGLMLIALQASAAGEKIQCKATTKAGKQCSRTAKKEGFCTQHYRIDSLKQSAGKR